MSTLFLKIKSIQIYYNMTFYALLLYCGMRPFCHRLLNNRAHRFLLNDTDKSCTYWKYNRSNNFHWLYRDITFLLRLWANKCKQHLINGSIHHIVARVRVLRIQNCNTCCTLHMIDARWHDVHLFMVVEKTIASHSAIYVSLHFSKHLDLLQCLVNTSIHSRIWNVLTWKPYFLPFWISYHFSCITV